jgi:hypothetical protein
MSIRCCLVVALLLFCSPPIFAAEDKVLLENWQTAYLEGLKVGHMHTLTTQSGTGAETQIKTKRTMELVIKRYGGIVALSVTQTCVETPEGQVVSLGLTQLINKKDKDERVGIVGETKVPGKKGKVVHLGKFEFPLVEGTVGLYAQETAFARKKVKKDDSVTLTSFEMMLPGTLTIRAKVLDREKVDTLVVDTKGDKLNIRREPAELLRVEATPDPIAIGERKIQLPGKVVWLDEKLMPVREQFEMPGLGTILFYNTTKEAVLKEGITPERLPDFGLGVNIPVKTVIKDPYQTEEVVYRVTTKGKLSEVFSVDERQSVKEGRDNIFDLTVRRVAVPEKDSDAKVGAEYLESNLFIDSDDEEIKKLASKIVGTEKDAWKKSVALEKWVHENMKSNPSVGFPNASQIAKDREGDCRQHALLLVALARAAGVPARTAVGLIYVAEPGKKPFLGFHMWGEVFVRGKWIPVDAVLGQGSVAATHLKMGDHSWAKTTTLAPLLPISQALGKLQIEIVSSK